MRFLLLSRSPCASAHAQYPTKPVRVLVGYAAGSSTDIVGRVMADRLSAYWKQSVYVETRRGCNLAPMPRRKRRAMATRCSSRRTVWRSAPRRFPTAVPRGDRPGTARPVAATLHILIVAPDFPAKCASSSRKRRRSRASCSRRLGVGNSDHLCGELFNLMAGVQAIHVPQGRRARAVDVMGGRIAYYFAGMPVGLPLAKSGKCARSRRHDDLLAPPIFPRWRSRAAGIRGDAMAGLLRAGFPCRPISRRASRAMFARSSHFRRQKTNCRARE